MLLGDLIFNDDFDLNCNFAVYKGQWNDGGTCVWSTLKNGYHKPPCWMLDSKIAYITIDIRSSTLIIEIECK